MNKNLLWVVAVGWLSNFPVQAEITVGKDQVLDLMKKDPQGMAKEKTQLDILLAGQAEKQALDANKRKAELKRRKKLQAQKLFDYARQRHEEAVARRSAGLSLTTPTFSKKPTTVNPQELAMPGKLPSATKPAVPTSSYLKREDVYAPYSARQKIIPDYKKDNFSTRPSLTPPTAPKTPPRPGQ